MSRTETIEAAKKLWTTLKGQIMHTINRLKDILGKATNKMVRLLVNDLETQNLFAKLQRLNQHFETTHEKYVSLREPKDDKNENE